MDLNEMQKMLQDAMVNFEEFTTMNIDSDELWDLSLTLGTNKRVKRVGGTYNRDKKLITINLNAIEKILGGEAPKKLIDNILRHELAHHIDHIDRGRSNHDYHFKKVCNEIGGMICTNSTTPYNSDIFKD